MDWKELEIKYAKLLRNSTYQDRKKLYFEAYSKVSELAAMDYDSENPEKRTAGTSNKLIRQIIANVKKTSYVLEIGCGRGYTCLKLAPHVKEIVGIDVSESSISEAKRLISKNNIKNVSIKKISALELIEDFEPNILDVCISIDLVEHLHPDDAVMHYNQVYKILKPGGKYIIKTPSKITGPHDITKDLFPKAKEALGFHLNETDYKTLIKMLRKIGFNKFRVFYPKIRFTKKARNESMNFPYRITRLIEIFYKQIKKIIEIEFIGKLIEIRLIAFKAK